MPNWDVISPRRRPMEAITEIVCAETGCFDIRVLRRQLTVQTAMVHLCDAIDELGHLGTDSTLMTLTAHRLICEARKVLEGELR